MLARLRDVLQPKGISGTGNEIPAKSASPSLNRFPIFAAFGVPEVWRYDGSRVAIHHLESGRYSEATSSLAFPPLTAELATRFLEERQRTRYTEWVRRVREWARRAR